MHCVKNKLKISGECSPPEQRQKKNAAQAKQNRGGGGTKQRWRLILRASICARRAVEMACVYNVTAFFYSDVLSEVFMSEAWGM